MTCEKTREWLPAYIDGELDAMRSLEVERHLEECAVCRDAREQLQRLSEAVRTHAPYHRAPVGLESRLRQRLAAESKAKPQGAASQWGRWAVAASIIVAAVSGYGVGEMQTRRAAGELLAREAVSAHVRSLMANHLIDVPSSDQHTVKPWFNGKLNFSPPVKDLTSNGFTLEGGRLDYLNGQPVAAIVYRRRQHAINLFIGPETDDAPTAKASTWNGYNVVGWQRQGVSYCAVSDLNSGELAEFARLAGG